MSTRVRECTFLIGLALLAVPPSAAARPELALQTGHTAHVVVVAYSPDGRLILTGGEDHTAILWQAATGRRLRTFQGHHEGIKALAFSPDGQQVATGSQDKTAIVWDVATGQRLRTLSGHKLEVIGVGFSADGRELHTGARGGGIHTWDLRTGQRRRDFLARGPTSFTVSFVTFRSDGTQVLTGSDYHTVDLWDTATGKKLRSFHKDLARFPFEVHTAAFRPDGRQVVLGMRNAILLFDLASGQKLRTLEGEGRSVAYSPDGKRILTSGLSKSAVLWDASTGQKLHTVAAGAPSRVSPLSFSPDGQQFLVGATQWDTATGQQVRALAGEVHAVNSVAFSADGQQLLVGNRQANLWHLTAGRLVRTIPISPTHGTQTMVFSPDGKQILAGSRDWTASLWDAKTGTKLRTFVGPRDRAVSVAFSRDGKQFLTGFAEGTAILWDAATGAKLTTGRVPEVLGRGTILEAVAISPDGKYLLLGGLNWTATLLDAATGQEVRRVETTLPIHAVAFSPDGRQFLTGSMDQQAVLWETSTGNKLRTFHGHRGAVRAVAFSPDGKLVLTGSEDNRAILWDAASGQLLRTLEGHGHTVSTVAFRPDGRQVATGSWDGSVRLWDVATGTEIGQLISLADGNDWAVVSPVGLFDGSRGGRERVAFLLADLELAPLDRFFRDNYYPGLLTEWHRGERPAPGKALSTATTPQLRLLVNPVADRPNEIHLDVGVTDQGGGVQGPWLLHNGAARGMGARVKAEGKTHTYRFPVTLVPGDNRLEVRAATTDGRRESDPVVVTVPFAGRLPPPDLHVLAIGINRFAPSAGIASLEFCVADAQALADQCRRRGGSLYRQVHVTQLADEKATKADILKAVTACAAKAQPQDTLLLYVASHGIAVGQRFYLIPHDFQVGTGEPSTETPRPAPTAVALRGYSATDEREHAVRAKGLAIDELGEELAKVPALKRVLIFDTCHSGSAIALAGKQHNPFAFRGAIERFSRAQGVYSLSATAADELAAETKELGHSILAYTLLAGLNAVERGPLAGKGLVTPGKEEAMDVLQWFRYAQQHTPRLYEQYVGRPQHLELSGEDQPTFPLLSGVRP